MNRNVNGCLHISKRARNVILHPLQVFLLHKWKKGVKRSKHCHLLVHVKSSTAAFPKLGKLLSSEMLHIQLTSYLNDIFQKCAAVVLTVFASAGFTVPFVSVLDLNFMPSAVKTKHIGNIKYMYITIILDPVNVSGVLGKAPMMSPYQCL